MHERTEQDEIKTVLLHTAKVLRDDVDMFRQLILLSEGGTMPPDILEKQAVLKEIEEALKNREPQSYRT